MKVCEIPLMFQEMLIEYTTPITPKTHHGATGKRANNVRTYAKCKNPQRTGNTSHFE
jgi:hypothetical protein